MRRKTISPNDYLSRERGARKQKWRNKLPVALIFPNAYAVGMSNLGFQLVYDLISQHPDIVCERFFAAGDGAQPLSVESNRPLRDFPVIFFSISFEQDFLLLVTMLAAAGIAPLARERGRDGAPVAAGSPLVIGGGVATFINPEPLAPFTDMFVVGEAEPVLPQLLDQLLGEHGGKGREELLLSLARGRQGCYVPQFYSFAYHPDGTIASINASRGLPARVGRAGFAGGSTAGHSKILTPDAEFADLFLVELGRGCSRGCRFCAAGFVYRPPRLWTAAAIIEALARRPEGIQRVGLLGMEMARPEELQKVAGYLLEQGCFLSFSSLRADALSETLLEVIAKSRLKTAAIAPDGGSERLRRVINKGIVEEDVLRAAELLVQGGVRHLKLYFMIGLPTETDADLEELVGLARKVKKRILAVGRARGRLSNMTLSVNSFVPKAWTPFQFHPFAPPAELKQKVRFLKKSLAGEANLRISADQPANAFFQAMLARGDRRVGVVLPHLAGAVRNWQRIYRQHGVRPEEYAMRERHRDEIFPWEIIDHGIRKDYLWAEYRRALSGRVTPACAVDRCRRCGVCHGE